MSQQALLADIIFFLTENGIEYMTTGSVVSSIQGEPRATHDVDIVVDIKEENLIAISHAYPPPRFYVSADAMKEAIRRKSMFNLLDTNTGDKVDFWLLTDEPFDKHRFERRYKETLPGWSMYVSSPEGTVIMKLRWSKLSGGSEKQLNDARSVYELQFERLDLAYIKNWVIDLGLEELWERLVIEAKPIL